MNVYECFILHTARRGNDSVRVRQKIVIFYLSNENHFTKAHFENLNKCFCSSASDERCRFYIIVCVVLLCQKIKFTQCAWGNLRGASTTTTVLTCNGQKS